VCVVACLCVLPCVYVCMYVYMHVKIMLILRSHTCVLLLACVFYLAYVYVLMHGDNIDVEGRRVKWINASSKLLLFSKKKHQDHAEWWAVQLV